MNLNLENGWQVLPIDGDTGTAYMGINKHDRSQDTSEIVYLFLKSLRINMHENNFIVIGCQRYQLKSQLDNRIDQAQILDRSCQKLRKIRSEVPQRD